MIILLIHERAEANSDRTAAMVARACVEVRAERGINAARMRHYAGEHSVWVIHGAGVASIQ